MSFFDKLENANPERRYVWANKGQAYMPGGPGWFGELGYRVETIQPGGVRPRMRGSLKDGDEIAFGDLILMSVERDEFEAQVAYAQDKASELERQIIKRRGIPDPLRGIKSPYFKVSGDVSPLTQDFGGASDG